MTSNPASPTRTSATHRPGPDLPGVTAPDTGDASGNAGPDCFWPTDGSTLPAPRVPLIDSLDQQRKPLSPSRLS